MFDKNVNSKHTLVVVVDEIPRQISLSKTSCFGLYFIRKALVGCDFYVVPTVVLLVICQVGPNHNGIKVSQAYNYMI